MKSFWALTWPMLVGGLLGLAIGVVVVALAVSNVVVAAAWGNCCALLGWSVGALVTLKAAR